VGFGMQLREAEEAVARAHESSTRQLVLAMSGLTALFALVGSCAMHYFHLEVHRGNRNLPTFMGGAEPEVLTRIRDTRACRCQMPAWHQFQFTAPAPPRPRLFRPLRTCGGCCTPPEDIKASFAEYDVDGNGQIDRHELAAVARKMGVKMNGAQLDEAMSIMDSDSSGGVSLAEFKAWYVRVWPLPQVLVVVATGSSHFARSIEAPCPPFPSHGVLLRQPLGQTHAGTTAWRRLARPSQPAKEEGQGGGPSRLRPLRNRSRPTRSQHPEFPPLRRKPL
jgi:hypothetical protein